MEVAMARWMLGGLCRKSRRGLGLGCVGMLWACAFAAGCGDAGTTVDPNDLLPEQCASNDACDDGNFCNGPETCDPTSARASTRGCVPGLPPLRGDAVLRQRGDAVHGDLRGRRRRRP